jgi:homoserine O-acetyltransferase
VELGHKCNLSDDELIKYITELQTLEIQTPEYRVENTKPEDYNSFIENRYKMYRKFFNSYDYASQVRAMLQQDISKNFNNSMQRAAENIKAKVFIIVSQTDHTVNPKPALDFANMINAQTYVFQNNCGHLGPGCDMKKFKEVVHNFLNKN